MIHYPTYFPDIAAWLATELAEKFPTANVDTRWPDADEAPTTWIAVRDDGIERETVATGTFTGALTCKARNEEHTRALAVAVASFVEDLWVGVSSPVVAVSDGRWPYPISDESYGVLYTMPLTLIVQATAGAPAFEEGN